MFINLELTMQPERLTPCELRAEKKLLLEALYHDNVDDGLVQWVHDLIDQAEDSGYHGGYSDAHWYAKGMGDGA